MKQVFAFLFIASTFALVACDGQKPADSAIPTESKTTNSPSNPAGDHPHVVDTAMVDTMHH